jgi:hypothetical protein
VTTAPPPDRPPNRPRKTASNFGTSIGRHGERFGILDDVGLRRELIVAKSFMLIVSEQRNDGGRALEPRIACATVEFGAQLQTSTDSWLHHPRDDRLTLAQRAREWLTNAQLCIGRTDISYPCHLLDSFDCCR